MNEVIRENLEGMLEEIKSEKDHVTKIDLSDLYVTVLKGEYGLQKYSETQHFHKLCEHWQEYLKK